MTYEAPEAFIGSKYESGRDVADIAKAVRSDIKKAVADGSLPGTPIKFSVKIDRFSMGVSLDVVVRNFSEPVSIESEYGGYTTTPAAKALEVRLTSIVDSYKRDASDSMVDHWDVNFYSNVSFDQPVVVSLSDREVRS